MASSLRVPVLLLAAVVLELAMTSTEMSYLPGGLQDADTSDKDVQQAVEFALHRYNSDNNDLYLSALVRVVRARRQVVAGMNYYLDLEIGRTTCTKDQSTQDACPFSEESTQLCSFVVYSRSWENYMDLTSFRCHSA